MRLMRVEGALVWGQPGAPASCPAKGQEGGKSRDQYQVREVGAEIGELRPYRGLLDVCVSPKAKTPYREPFFWNYGQSISSPVLANLPPKNHAGSQGMAVGVGGRGLQENRSRLSSLY